MPTIQHSALTNSELHEPKNVSGAADGTVYVANGAGSGAWEKIQGWEQYQDSRRTVGSPAQNIATGVRTQFLCNGGFLTERYPPSDKANDFWNTSTNKHIPIAAYDSYLVRCSFSAQNYAGATPYITIELDIGGSIGVILSQLVPLQKGGAEQQILMNMPVFTGTTYVSNGGAIYLTYTGTGSCDIFKNSIFVQRLSRNG